MTLKEKFGELYVEKGMSTECEKISNEFAIGFAEWVIEGYESLFLDTAKELLEIYKKEKGL